jgi:hypothetical protein
VNYTEEVLDALRQEGDPLADRVIAEIHATGVVGAVNGVLRQLMENDQPIPENLPPLVREYLHITDNPPAWMDAARMARANAFFESHGMHISLVMSTAGMIECYAARKAVKVLDFTHQLDHPQRRMAETAQFCLHMMSPQAFAPNGKFIPATQKVRLMHAAFRHLILQSGRWPLAELGVPICQEDLLGALMLFSTEVLTGLERLEVPATAQEADDYYYVWRVVGEMMGIRPDIIPATLAEAQALNAVLRARHFGASPEGVRLTRSLLDMYDDLIPGELVDGIMPALVRIITGDQIADWMGVPRNGWSWVARGMMRFSAVLEELQDDNHLVRGVLDKAEWAIVNGQFLVLNGRRKIHYDIPDELRLAWKLDDPVAPITRCPYNHPAPALDATKG